MYPISVCWSAFDQYISSIDFSQFVSISVGWAAFDDIQLFADDKDEESSVYIILWILLKICIHFGFFSVGWAAFDDFELVADDNDEECVIKPPEAVPHIPSLGDCTFQVFIR